MRRWRSISSVSARIWGPSAHAASTNCSEFAGAAMPLSFGLENLLE